MTIARLIHRHASIEVLVTGWRTLIQSVAGFYRPECHYMRGPGPRSRAKHEMRADGSASE